jgi:hypothetical protein
LAFEGLRRRIHRSLKRAGMFLGKQFLTWNGNADFNRLIVNSLIVQSEKYFSTHQSVIKRMEFVKSLLYEVDELLIGIEVNGMNA